MPNKFEVEIRLADNQVRKTNLKLTQFVVSG